MKRMMQDYRTACGQEKYMNLTFCKFYNDRAGLGIGLDLHKFSHYGYLPNGKQIMCWSPKWGPPLAQMAWNDKLYQWTHYQWALLIISVCKRLKLRNIKEICICYKYIQPSGIKRAHFFVEGIQTELNKLRRRKRFRDVFDHENVGMLIDLNVYGDIVLYFDTDPDDWVYSLCKVAGFPNIDESQKLRPALTHSENPKFVVDADGKKCKSRKKYILKRIVSGTKNGRVTNLDIQRAKWMYGLVKMTNDLAIRKLPFQLYYYQKTKRTGIEMKRIARKLIMKLECQDLSLGVLLSYLKHCEVCQVVIEKHRKYVPEDSRGDVVFVKKIMICQCKELMVCSRRCYKHAWSRMGHRCKHV